MLVCCGESNRFTSVVLGGLGLPAASKLSESAHWASWPIAFPWCTRAIPQWQRPWCKAWAGTDSVRRTLVDSAESDQAKVGLVEQW